MSLKNRDGSVYKLSSPNPLTQTQKIWDFNKENIVLHNFQWNSETHENTEKPITAITGLIPYVQTIEEAPKLTIEAPVEEMPVLDNSHIPKPEPKSNLKNIVVIHCLPLRENKNELYDETIISFNYGKKFTFEAIILEATDLNLSFWTNIEIERNSVIYPSYYKATLQKYGDYRWWKIQNKEPKSNGYLYTTIFSELHPDFSG